MDKLKQLKEQLKENCRGRILIRKHNNQVYQYTLYYDLDSPNERIAINQTLYSFGAKVWGHTVSEGEYGFKVGFELKVE